MVTIMKKKGILMLLIMAMLSMTACSARVSVECYDVTEIEKIWVSGDYAIYESFSDLARHTTDVVSGKILSERVEWINPFFGELPEDMDLYYIYTIYKVEVFEVFQGTTMVGDIIEIAQFGGMLDNVYMIYEERVHLEVGDNLVLFLHASDNDEFEFPFSLMNPTQSVYQFDSGRGGDGAMDMDEILEGVHPDSNLNFTIQDLVDLQSSDY